MFNDSIPPVCSNCDKAIPTDIDKESQVIYISNKPINYYVVHSNGCNECIPCLKKREKSIRENGSILDRLNLFQNITTSIIKD